jgi:hypothetical protein
MRAELRPDEKHRHSHDLGLWCGLPKMEVARRLFVVWSRIAFIRNPRSSASLLHPRGEQSGPVRVRQHVDRIAAAVDSAKPDSYPEIEISFESRPGDP